MIIKGLRVINTGTKSMFSGQIGIVTEIWGDISNENTVVCVQYSNSNVLGRHPVRILKPYTTMLPESLFEL